MRSYFWNQWCPAHSVNLFLCCLFYFLVLGVAVKSSLILLKTLQNWPMASASCRLSRLVG